MDLLSQATEEIGRETLELAGSDILTGMGAETSTDASIFTGIGSGLCGTIEATSTCFVQPENLGKTSQSKGSDNVGQFGSGKTSDTLHVPHTGMRESPDSSEDNSIRGQSKKQASTGEMAGDRKHQSSKGEGSIKKHQGSSSEGIIEKKQKLEGSARKGPILKIRESDALTSAMVAAAKAGREEAKSRRHWSTWGRKRGENPNAEK
jgi:hypothetical protein